MPVGDQHGTASHVPATIQLYMREVSEESANKAVQRTLASLGIDAAEPIEAQKDMQALREVRKLLEDDGFRKDMLHLREWRLSMERVRRRGMVFFMWTSFLGLVALVLYGIKTFKIGS